MSKFYRNAYFLLEAALLLAFFLFSTIGWGIYAIGSFFLFILVALFTGLIASLLGINIMLAQLFPFSYLTLLLQLFPKNARYYTIRARAYLLRKQYAETVKDCDRALALKITIAETYAYRGQAHAGLKEHQKAIEDYTSALALKPRNARFYTNRGWAYLSLKEFQNAQYDFAQALTYSRNFSFAYLGQGFAHTMQKENTQALKSFEKAIELSVMKQTQARAYGGRAFTYLQMGEYRKALQNYNLRWLTSLLTH